MSSAYNIVVQTLKLVDDDEGYPDYAEVIKTEYTGGDWQETKYALENIYNKNVKAFEEFAEVDSKLEPAYDKYHKALRKYNDYEKMSKTLSEQDDLYKDKEVTKQESIMVTATYFDLLNESKRWNNHGKPGSLEMLRIALKEYGPKLRATTSIKSIKDINDWVDKYAVDEGNHFELVSKIAGKLFIVE